MKSLFPLRSARRGAGMALALAANYVDFACLWAVHHGSKRSRSIPLKDRARWMQRSCKRVARALHLHLEVQGTLPQKGLIASNHLSYLDILAYAAALPCIFVSKSEVRGWPVFGLLARLGGTLFVERDRRTGVESMSRQMEAVLMAGLPLVLFPEGTSTDGSMVLPYYPSLLQPALDCAVPITPAAIGYSAQGAAEQQLCYYGEVSFAPHLRSVLRIEQTRATVYFGDPETQFADRKEAARELRDRTLALRAKLVGDIL